MTKTHADTTTARMPSGSRARAHAVPPGRSGRQESLVGRPLSLHPLARLQGLAGNRAAGAWVQTKLRVNEPGDAFEQEADQVAEAVMRMPASSAAPSPPAAPPTPPSSSPSAQLPIYPSRPSGGSPAADPIAEAPQIVHAALRSPGQGLDPAARAYMEPRFGLDFSHVRIHTGAQADESARAVNALAYTVGRDVVFGAGQYAPGTEKGRRLLAHELVHVGQQGGGSAGGPLSISAGAEVTGPNPGNSAGRVAVQRKVEMRDVGKGEQSGYHRVNEIIDRLNATSTGLTYSMNGKELAYVEKPGATLGEFDRQMKALIDGVAVLPMRLTNKQGLLGSSATGFHDQVDGDAWTSGYVDVDDLLAGTDLGFQSLLLHFLAERRATKNYDKRIGTATFTAPEFTRVHNVGIEAEAKLLRDFFGDPTIKIVNDSPSATIRRVFRNNKKVLFRRRIKLGKGTDQSVGGSYIDVRTPDGKVHTPEEYLKAISAKHTGGASR